MRDQYYEPLQSVLSSDSESPSEKILKIIMPNDILDDDVSVPSSFSPPSTKLPKRKANVDYRELSHRCEIQRNSVRFHSKVLVMRIPSRSQYTESMKRNMWCSLSGIARSAQRNTIEFTSEGWDWRNAVEEDSMYVHPKTGQYIHPVHVHRAASSASMKPTTPEVDREESISTFTESNRERVGSDTTGNFTDHTLPAHE